MLPSACSNATIFKENRTSYTPTGTFCKQIWREMRAMQRSVKTCGNSQWHKSDNPMRTYLGSRSGRALRLNSKAAWQCMERWPGSLRPTKPTSIVQAMPTWLCTIMFRFVFLWQGCTGNGTERIFDRFFGTERIFGTGTDYFKERNGIDRNGFFDGMERNGFSGPNFLEKYENIRSYQII